MERSPLASTEKSNTGSYLLVAMLTLLWGTNWPLFPLAVREVSVWTFRAVCLLGSGLLLMAWCCWKGHDLRVPRRHWKTIAVAALVYLVIWNIASTYAAVLIPTGQAAVLGFTMPLWAVMGARLFLRERLTGRLLAAIGLTAAGVLLLLFKGWRLYADAPIGFVSGLLAGVGWAAGTLLLRRHPVPVNTTVLTAWQLLIAGVPLGLLALLFGTREWFWPSWQSVAVIGYITVIPMAIGNVAWFTIVDRLPTSVSTLSPILVPVVAMISGAIGRGEPLGLLECTAMACSALGLFLGLRRKD